jgi:hypothetical protein
MQIQKNSKQQGGAAKRPSHAFRGGGGAIFPHVRPIFRKRRANDARKLCEIFYRISIIFEKFEILQFIVNFCGKLA